MRANMNESVKISVDKTLLDHAKTLYPETKGLNYTGLTDFLVRLAIKTKENMKDE